MTKYLVAVGGSGQHVALAVADYLVLAHGVHEKPLPPIQFFLLDSDPAATKTDQFSAWDLSLQQLKALHDADPTIGSPQPKHDHPYPDLRSGVETARQAVTDLLGPSAAALLLSNDEAEVRIREGYFGKPHIAGILTEALLDRVEAEQVPPQHVIRQLVNALRTDARICLTGSTVGGTGAGVLPRLVEYLAGKNERARICANIGLEWFQIKPDQETGAARQVQMPPNATASLWHYVRERTRDKYRLVLWGHPAIGSATQELDRGDRFQPVKDNLTLPINAAAAAIAFLFGDEVQTAEVVPVIETDHVGLARSLDFGLHDLNWLIERNRDLIGRLALLKSYIESPYVGSVIPWLRRDCRVAAIDRLSSGDKQRLVSAIDTMTAAKLRALRRLGDSDTRLTIGPSIERRGITTLRTYVRESVRIDAITKTLNEVAAASRPDSANRLIRNDAMNRQPFPAAAVGTRQPLETGHLDAVAQFDNVEAERVPNILATECVLSSFFTHATRDALVDRSLLLNRFGEIQIPHPLDTIDGDRVQHWVHRWLFLFSALVSGVVTYRPLERPVEGITDALYVDRTSDPIGYLSESLAVVPNFNPFWSNETQMQSVSSRSGGSEALSTWLQIIESALACADRPGLPTALAYARELFPEEKRRNRLMATPRTLPLTFDRRRNVPLPANDGEQLLVDAICTALEVPIQNLQAADRNFLEPERQIWEDLNSRRVPYRPIHSANDATWTPINDDAEIIWGDLLSDTTRSYRFDDVVLYPKRKYGWRRRTMARYVTPADVILEQTAVLVTADGRRLATIPVRSEFAGLVSDARQSVTSDGSVHFEITLSGRPAVYERRYSSADVIELTRLTILAWPAMSSLGSSSQSLLITDNTDVRYKVRIIYSDENRNTVISPVLLNALYPHYLLPRDQGVTATMKPTLLTMQIHLPDESDWTDVGLLEFDRADGPNTSGAETWAVDFGTSSTVIVRAPGASEPLIVRPTIERDSTVAYSCGASILRRKNFWYHTWDGSGPSGTESNFVPSQLINVAAIRGESRRPSDMVFGRDFMIDHGEEFDGARHKNIIDYLKWHIDPKHRTDYLKHLLEQAITMEIARTKRENRNFPAEIRMVFTLPLRQRSGVDRFSKEIDEIAVALKRRVGVAISPQYQWESLAVAPPVPSPGRMIVVADLGGGTLDMYARYLSNTGADNQAADSARIGGRFCFSMLGTKLGEDLNEHRKFLRVASAATRDDLAGSRVEAYFDLVYRYVVLWSAALRKKWNVPDSIDTHVQLAGMTWSLPGAATSQTNVASILSRVARGLGYQFAFHPYDQDLSTSGREERKLFMAKSAAKFNSFNPQELNEEANKLQFILGLRSTAGAAEVDEVTDLKDVHPPDRSLYVSIAEGTKLYPSATEVMLNHLTFRLKEAMDTAGVGPGGYDTANQRFGLSPLTVLAELAVEQIAPEAYT